MPLLPDPAELFAIADRLAGQASAARTQAARLGTAVAAGRWHGTAADAFQIAAFGVIAGLRSSAGRLDEAAEALRRHGRRVAETLARIEHLVRDAERTGAHLRHGLTDILDHPSALLTDTATIAGDTAGLVRDGLHLLGS